jgi:hypothetical protein
VLFGPLNEPATAGANTDLAADCRTETTIGDTTIKLPGPRRVLRAISFATALIITPRLAKRSPRYAG